MKHNQKKNKSKELKILAYFLALCIIILSVVIGNKVATDYNEYKEVNDTQEKIIGDVVETSPNDNQTKEFSINWSKLLSINADIIAWIRVPDTDISYPVVQGETNSQYLRKNIYGDYSRGGTPFVRAEQQEPFNCANTIVYGHNLMNGKIFAQLKNYRNKSFADEHNKVYVYLPSGEIRKYQVYSFHTIEASDEQVYGLCVDSTLEYSKAMNKGNVLDTDIDVDDSMQVLTLSTCTNKGDGRYVLHAVYDTK